MKIVKTVSITLILFIVAVCAINAPDRELRPEVRKVVAFAQSPLTGDVPDEKNAYFAVLGFEAPDGEDIAAAGSRVHSEYYNSIRNRPQGIPSSRDTVSGPVPSFVRPSDIPQCKIADTDCLGFYEQNTEKHAKYIQLVEANLLLLERYEQLHSYPVYQDLMRFNPWTSWAELSSGIYSAHLLSVAGAAFLFKDGQHFTAVDMLVKDILLWRKMFAGTSDIVGKTTALQALMRGYTLLDDMVASLTQGGEALNVLRDVVSPLSKEEKSLDLVFDGYMQALYWSLSNHRLPFDQSRMSFPERYFYKVNATLNEAYDIFASLKETARAAPGQFTRAMTVLETKITDAKRTRIDMLYNPLGKMFIAGAFSSSVASDWNNGFNMLEEKITKLRNKAVQKGLTHDG